MPRIRNKIGKTSSEHISLPHFVLFAVDIPGVLFVFIYNYLQRGPTIRHVNVRVPEHLLGEVLQVYTWIWLIVDLILSV